MLKELVLRNRSYRSYDETREIKREELMDLVEHARLCASSVNQQPLKYYLAYTKEDINKIQPLTAAGVYCDLSGFKYCAEFTGIFKRCWDCCTDDAASCC